ncbi:uncharacterized protein LOC106476800, partial [Limulus polyphemus]|uniref:Uncharacterized protein LOC106476800 n=1 Tax=Limulus polyphemus TaxID=6850 RepID=A0ABM1C249_LIMPO
YSSFLLCARVPHWLDDDGLEPTGASLGSQWTSNFDARRIWPSVSYRFSPVRGVIMDVLDKTKGLGLLLFLILVDPSVVAPQSRMEWLDEDPIEADYEVVYPKVHRLNRDRRSLDKAEVLMTLRKNNTILYIQLYPNTDLTNSNLTVSIMREDGTSQSFQPIVLSSDEPCLFTGRIINDKGGKVALSTCDDEGKMYGVVSTPDGAYILQPVSEKVRRSVDSNDNVYPHALIRHSNEDSFCGLDGI